MSSHATMKTVGLDGLKIGLCQQRTVPARPDYNGMLFEGYIDQAEHYKIDLLVGVEGIQGYLIGDQYEYNSFQVAVADMNDRIFAASVGKKVAVAYGSLITHHAKKGEDGRVMRWNGGYIVQDGYVERSNKTLSPNYRMFPEARYFFSNRHLAERIALETCRPLKEVLKELLTLVSVKKRNGETYRVGQIFCEDMWHADYAINPLLLMSEHAEPNEEWIAVNHSSSPWTWRKNNKRHRVVKELMQSIPAERRPKLFVYVNRTGVEQSNKNFYVYDGSSAVYDSDGDLIYEVMPFEEGTKIFTFSSAGHQKIEGHTPDDTKALYDAMATVVDQFYGSVPDESRFVYVGLSGGIDSSVKAALLVSRLGKERVIGVNMPYGNYNSPEGISDAESLAEKLGIKYMTIDITKSVDQDAEDCGVLPGTLAHQNIQARHRMLKLAALCQKEELINGLLKKGGLFTANGNKDEMAFGYGTMYADIAGATMLLGDLVKREVYQLGDYMNREIFREEVIPARIFERKPTAELNEEKSPDPFDYGNLQHRGYHDEWVRAVMEFRWDPLRFLMEYDAGTLEQTMLLPEGHLKKLFPTAKEFVERLERDWKSFTFAYFKRVQCPICVVVTRRAFGGDLSESIYNFDPRIEPYRDLKERLLAK